MRSTDDVMYILYRRRNWGQKDIALLFDCNVSTVCRHIQAAAANRGEAITALMMYNAGTEDKPKILRNKELFQELYVRQGKSIQEISELLMCAHGTIENRLKHYNIEVRAQGKPNTKKENTVGDCRFKRLSRFYQNKIMKNTEG